MKYRFCIAYVGPGCDLCRTPVFRVLVSNFVFRYRSIFVCTSLSRASQSDCLPFTHCQLSSANLLTTSIDQNLFLEASDCSASQTNVICGTCRSINVFRRAA